jgi:phosphoribosylaminoimidazolecarboxamide formyltransferase/IMP cyclohydrolase
MCYSCVPFFGESTMSHRVRRALVSVFDKQGVVELCRELVSRKVEILSSGGTARLLEDNGVAVRKVSDYTGFPEMLGGRVKTLHPAIHGGILAVRSEPGHMEDLERAGLGTIDLVVVNLYPFEQTIAREGTTRAQAIEMIDIGGPTMVRAAAKNHGDVGVVVDPADYADVTREIAAEGGLSDATRRRLAVKAFGHTGAYDRAIAAYLTAGEPAGDAATFPETLRLELEKVRDLRYGENPHQSAAVYVDPASSGPSVVRAEPLQGKALSFNNLLDFDAALCLATEFDDGACVIIKHGNPCGAALGDTPLEAFQRALACDPVSAFGGVIAFNRPLDGETARTIAESFYEGVIAPEFSEDAREGLARKKKLRLLETGDLAGFARDGRDFRRISGGLLVQDWDRSVEVVRECKVATRRQPSDDEWRTLEFAWVVCKHVKSNAIVYAADGRTVGVGAGQMSRVDSAKIGVEKAQLPLDGAVMASDAFFPFRDAIDAAAEAGIKAVVQPGGSIRDEELIEAADEHGMAMVLTGHRHFRH